MVRLFKINPRTKSRLTSTLLLLLLAISSRQAALAQASLNEDQIKAGFLFNFIRFVEWPDQTYATASSPTTVCVVGNSSIAALLTDAAAGKEIGGHAIRVKAARATEDLRTCNLVFIDDTEERNAGHIVDSLKNSSTLTIGEFPGFAQAGGMLNFFTQENKVKLEVNLDAAEHAHLKISAKLIAVSRLVSKKSIAGGA